MGPVCVTGLQDRSCDDSVLYRPPVGQEGASRETARVVLRANRFRMREP